MNSPAGSTWDRARILIVDDELPVRLALQAILAEHYEVVLAEDAVQAELRMESLSFQVVLTDFNLPGRSGTDLINSILDKFPEVVVILLTGHASKPAVRSAGRDRNVFAVLTKPYEPAALLRSLRLAVATSHLLTLRHNPQAARPRAGAPSSASPARSSSSPSGPFSCQTGEHRSPLGARAPLSPYRK